MLLPVLKALLTQLGCLLVLALCMVLSRQLETPLVRLLQPPRLRALLLRGARNGRQGDGAG